MSHSACRSSGRASSYPTAPVRISSRTSGSGFVENGMSWKNACPSHVYVIACASAIGGGAADVWPAAFS
ncbi:hypothetical protein WMF18_31940 [Sorangium sp. So ce315]|uniref:hypothetical protein n=1 Tax=Sorangium sp. So ce315 TaxID=3133299 RepID=UPI003F63C7A7